MPNAAEALAAAQGVFDSISREATQGAISAADFTDPRSVSAGYWRKPDGWIRLSQYGQNSMDALMRGHTMLPRYGQFAPPGAAGPNDPLRFDPLYMLVRNGGAHEVPPEQVQNLRWHRRPQPNAKPSHKLLWERVSDALTRGLDEADAVETALPQLRGTDWRTWQDVKCQFCPGRVFNNSDDVARHESVMHQEDVRTRELRDSISTALKEGGQPQGPLMAVLSTLLERMSAESQESRQQVAALVEALTAAKAEAPETPRRRGRPAADDE